MKYSMQMPYLAHHGVKGQKWYQRRYQNYDGSLTPAGRVHYGYGSGKTRNAVTSTAGSASSRAKKYTNSDGTLTREGRDKYTSGGPLSRPYTNRELDRYEQTGVLKRDKPTRAEKDAAIKRSQNRLDSIDLRNDLDELEEYFYYIGDAKRGKKYGDLKDALDKKVTDDDIISRRKASNVILKSYTNEAYDYHFMESYRKAFDKIDTKDKKQYEKYLYDDDDSTSRAVNNTTGSTSPAKRQYTTSARHVSASGENLKRKGKAVQVSEKEYKTSQKEYEKEANKFSLSRKKKAAKLGEIAKNLQAKENIYKINKDEVNTAKKIYDSDAKNFIKNLKTYNNELRSTNPDSKTRTYSEKTIKIGKDLTSTVIKPGLTVNDIPVIGAIYRNQYIRKRTASERYGG